MTRKSSGSGVFRFLRTVFILALIVAVVLIFLTPNGVPPLQPPFEVTRKYAIFEEKFLELVEGRVHGLQREERFSTGEINSALVKNMPAEEDLRVVFGNDEATVFYIKTYLSTKFYLKLNGKPGISHGHLTFKTTGAQLGELPLPAAFVDWIVQRKLREPETQEQLKMPEFINHLEVQKDELVIREVPRGRIPAI